jgi:hypothetical protein
MSAKGGAGGNSIFYMYLCAVKPLTTDIITLSGYKVTQIIPDKNDKNKI